MGADRRLGKHSAGAVAPTSKESCGGDLVGPASDPGGGRAKADAWGRRGIGGDDAGRGGTRSGAAPGLSTDGLRACAVACALGNAWMVPEEALVEATRRDRLRGWIMRVGSEMENLAPADGDGLAWSAIGLKVPHPDRPHRLTVTVTGGHPAALGVALVTSSGGQGGRPRVVLDACASGPPILQDGPPATFSWLVWPDAVDPVLVLVNHDSNVTVQLGTITLTELAEVPAPLVIVPPSLDTARSLGLSLTGPNALERFGGGGETGPRDPLTSARNLAQYLVYCGATVMVLPEGLTDRERRQALDGQAGEDATGPDRLDLLLRILARQGCSAWLELTFDGPLPGLPPPDSVERCARPGPHGSSRARRRAGLPPAPSRGPRGDAASGFRGDRVAEGPVEPGRPADPARSQPDPAGEPRHRAR